YNPSIEAEDVDVLINAPLLIGAGETFTFDVLIENHNEVAMTGVEISIEYPQGTRDVADVSRDYLRDRDTIGNIGVGSLAKQTYSAVLFGEENDLKEVRVFVTYQVEGSTATFEKEKVFDVTLRSTPVRLSVANVRELTSGQNLKFNVELVSNSSQ